MHAARYLADTRRRSSELSAKCLSRGRAARHERPFDRLCAVDPGELQALCVACVGVLLKSVEGRMEGTERVTEEAVIRVRLSRGRVGTNVVGALVVSDRHGAARDIVGAVGMRQRHHAGTQSGEEGQQEPRSPNR